MILVYNHLLPVMLFSKLQLIINRPMLNFISIPCISLENLSIQFEIYSDSHTISIHVYIHTYTCVPMAL